METYIETERALAKSEQAGATETHLLKHTLCRRMQTYIEIKTTLAEWNAPEEFSSASAGRPAHARPHGGVVGSEASSASGPQHPVQARYTPPFCVAPGWRRPPARGDSM